MATTNGLIAGQLKGSLGKELVFREWAGLTIVSKAPRSRGNAAGSIQAEMQERFVLGARYARNILKDPDMAEAYRQTLKPRQNLYSRALQDFVVFPVVKEIIAREYKGQPGDTITIRAIDDFRVARVQVEIYSASGDLLESGEAVAQAGGFRWDYTATQANQPLAGSTVKAIATDVPGNQGSLEMVV